MANSFSSSQPTIDLIDYFFTINDIAEVKFVPTSN